MLQFSHMQPCWVHLQVLLLTCTNSGGPGQFQICRAGQDTDSPDKAQDDPMQLGPFQISPAAFALDRQEQIELKFAFQPDQVGPQTESFLVKCSNGTQTAYQISSKGQPETFAQAPAAAAATAAAAAALAGC